MTYGKTTMDSTTEDVHGNTKRKKNKRKSMVVTKESVRKE
jgi:hypothetical protein